MRRIGKKKFIFVGIAILIVAFLVGVRINAYDDSSATYRERAQSTGQQPLSPAKLLTQANALRKEKGVAPLLLDERLNQSAQAKAEDFKVSNYYAHTNPITGETGPKLIFKHLGECQHGGENIDTDEVPNTGYSPFDKKYGWPSSPSHYAAEIDPRYELTGFGYVEAGGKGYYVQHFCDLP